LAILQAITISPEQEQVCIFFAASVEQRIPNDSTSHDAPAGQTGSGKAASNGLQIAALASSLIAKRATTVWLVVGRIGLSKHNLRVELLP
jgi:hypothetical protein